MILDELFGLTGKVAVVTGATGTLGGAMAKGLAAAGARVGIIGRRAEVAEALVVEIRAAGGEAMALPADVLDKDALIAVRTQVLDQWGGVDILVNAAGGNVPAATLGPDRTIFDLPREAFAQVFDLNLMGSLLPTQVFGAVMAGQLSGQAGGGHDRNGHGTIVMISSMASQRALTRVVGYGAAKAAVDNFTRWMATELARTYGGGLRVNAIAPGFFIGEQNRALLTEPDGSLTARGESIIAHTPAGRFGEPDELVSTLLWLCGTGARFVNGIVVPVDGGFSAFSGV